MFKIKPLEDKNEQKLICDACGAIYYKNALAFASIDFPDINSDEGNVIGICEFIIGDFPAILTVKSAAGYENDESVLIMIHTVCSFLERCGCTSVTAPENTDKNYMSRCGFKFTDGKYFCDLTRRGCASHKEDAHE